MNARQLVAAFMADLTREHGAARAKTMCRRYAQAKINPRYYRTIRLGGSAEAAPSPKARAFAKRYGRPGGPVPPGLMPSRRQVAAMLGTFAVLEIPPVGVALSTVTYERMRGALRAVADFSFDAVRRKKNYATALKQWCRLKRQARTALAGLRSRRTDTRSGRTRT